MVLLLLPIFSFLFFFYTPRRSTSYIIFHYNVGTGRLINTRVVTLPTERHVLTRARTRGCGLYNDSNNGNKIYT